MYLDILSLGKTTIELIRRRMKRKKELNSDIVDLEYAEKVVIARYKEGLSVDLEVAKRLIELRKEVSDNEECLLYIDARNLVSITKEARKYVASDEGQENLKATAILTDSSFLRILSNFLIRIDLKKESSRLPIKMFKSESEALNWLKQFK